MTLRIGVLTSGGDAPGMNAVVAGACERVEALGGELLGVRDGFLGLTERRAGRVSMDQALSHAGESGTWLRTSRWPVCAKPRDAGRARREPAPWASMACW